MPRRRTSDQNLPPLPDERPRRTEQVKIRLSPEQVADLEALRPDRKAPGVVALIVDDVLSGRYRPAWGLPLARWDKGDARGE
jgi:hypothetical protein